MLAVGGVQIAEQEVENKKKREKGGGVLLDFAVSPRFIDEIGRRK